MARKHTPAESGVAKCRISGAIGVAPGERCLEEFLLVWRQAFDESVEDLLSILRTAASQALDEFPAVPAEPSQFAVEFVPSENTLNRPRQPVISLRRLFIHNPADLDFVCASPVAGCFPGFRQMRFRAGGVQSRVCVRLFSIPSLGRLARRRRFLYFHG